MKNWRQRIALLHEHNRLEPHALQKAAIMGMLMLVLISFAAANLQSIFWIGSDWLVSTILPAVVAEATNEARAAEGRPPLARSPLLDEAARLKAEDMARESYFAHWSPAGVSPWHWFAAAGYRYTHAGENLAVHFTDSGAVVDAWLDSPTHRDNILNEHYTEIGIGTAEGQYEGYDTVFVVQMFGTPAAPAAAGAAPAAASAEAAEPSETAAAPTAPLVAGAQTLAGSEVSVDVTRDGKVVYESFMATTAPGGAGATIRTYDPAAYRAPSIFERVLTSPRLVLQFAYGLLGSLIALALIASIIIERRQRHSLQIAYGFALLALMVFLFQLHIAFTSNALIA